MSDLPGSPPVLFECVLAIGDELFYLFTSLCLFVLPRLCINHRSCVMNVIKLLCILGVIFLKCHLIGV